MTNRPRGTLKALLAARDPNATRPSKPDRGFDAEPAGRASGTVRILPPSRFRRELASILRRGETVAIERRGEVVARLIPAVTVERMNEAIRRRGASAGVLSHVFGDSGVTDDESRDDAIAKDNFASLLSAMPAVGRDSDFERDG